MRLFSECLSLKHWTNADSFDRVHTDQMGVCLLDNCNFLFSLVCPNLSLVIMFLPTELHEDIALFLPYPSYVAGLC